MSPFLQELFSSTSYFALFQAMWEKPSLADQFNAERVPQTELRTGSADDISAVRAVTPEPNLEPFTGGWTLGQ